MAVNIHALNKIDLEAAVVQNDMVGNINALMIPNQFRPMARELASRGEQPFALVTATQMANANLRAQQPEQCIFTPAAVAYNQFSARRWKQY